MTDEAMTAVESQADEILARHIEYMGWPESGQNMMKVRNARAAIVEALTLARQSVGVEEMRKWALEKAATHHRFAHEDEHLRTEHIASSSAYRNLAEELPAILSRLTGEQS